MSRYYYDTMFGGGARDDDDSEFVDDSQWTCSSSKLSFLLDRNPPGELVMVLVTFIYALQSLVAKIVERRVTALELVTYRSILAGLVTLRLLLRTTRDADLRLDERLFGRRSRRGAVVLRGLVGASAFICLYVALEDIGVGEHTALLFTNPLLISILARPLLGERLGLSNLVALVFGAIGALLVAQPRFLVEKTAFGRKYGDFAAKSSSSSSAEKRSERRSRGVAMALLGAVLVAVTMLIVRKVGTAVPSLCLAMSFHLYSATLGSNALALGLQNPSPLFFPPRVVVQRDASSSQADDDDSALGAVSSPRGRWPEVGLIVLISLSSFVGQPLLNYGYQHLPAARAASLNYLQLLWAVVLGYVVIGERPSTLQLVGSFLITLGGLSVALCSSKTSTTSTERTSSSSSKKGSIASFNSTTGRIASSPNAATPRDRANDAFDSHNNTDVDKLLADDDDGADLLGA